MLRAYGIPAVPTRAVASPDDAAMAAQVLGFPAVVKLRQSVRPNQRASGGLALELHNVSEVTKAAARIAAQSGREELPLLVQRQADTVGESFAFASTTTRHSGRLLASAKAARRLTYTVMLRLICRRSTSRWPMH